MATRRGRPQTREGGKEPLDLDALKSQFDVSNFDLNAIIRGIQLTFVGVNRALQNQEIFTNKHYKQAAYAVAAGIVIRLTIAIPIFLVKASLWFLSFFISMEDATWDDTLVNGLDFIAEYVLQVPFFLMVLMRYVSPTLDNLFMDSLRWVDVTYVQKHKNERPSSLRSLYYPNLKLYRVTDGSTHNTSLADRVTVFLSRFAKRGLISLAVYALSFTPLIGRFVLPAASFYTFNSAVGLGPASAIFAAGLFLPRAWLVVFLQTYFSTRSLMRELLEPYFARIHFTSAQKKQWFHSRAGLLFGFALAFNVLIRVPLVGVLVYGLAEASTAYLLTKITDPPPPPQRQAGFAESQTVWRNKQKFLGLSLSNLDALQTAPPSPPPSTATATGMDLGTGPSDDPPLSELPSYEEAMAALRVQGS
ncbi:hypothetical protein jhhlp_001616 [Lomentospora prolificans]|uniref:Transmembrane protein UsgS n=1 Tax=Lomentospora prolificans TaxID=41688 RepID=A0A2N3NIP7_9PEZI|nr:hypothetical protein jhhlp_001616 [Lomentospora prolificans]